MKRVKKAHAWAVQDQKTQLIESVHYSRRAARSRKDALLETSKVRVVKLVPSEVLNSKN